MNEQIDRSALAANLRKVATFRQVKVAWLDEAVLAAADLIERALFAEDRGQAIERMLPVLERAKLVPFFVGDRQWCAALLAAAEGRET